MGNSHKSSKTKETTEASGEKNTTNGSKVKRKKACLSCLKSRTSDAADDAAENNSTTQTKTEEKKSDAVCLPAAEASKATKETPISADFRGKETATQAVSNRGSTYDNIRSNEKTEAAEIHKAQTSESNEMKNDHEFTQKDIHDTEKPKETRLGGCQLSSHVPAPAASTAQPFCNVNSASNAGHLVKNDTEAAFEYKIDRPIKTFHVPDQHHQLLPSDKHHAQLSYKQESVPRQKAKMVNDNTEKTHPENWSTCPEGSNEMRQEHFTNVSNCECMPEFPTMSRPIELGEIKFCPSAVVDDVDKTDDKTSKNESLNDTSAETIQTRSTINLSNLKASVDLSVDQNSDGQLPAQDEIGLGNGNITPLHLLSTVCVLNAESSDYSTGEENKKAFKDTRKGTDEICCSVEQRIQIIPSKLNISTRLQNENEDGIDVAQTVCDTYEMNEIRETGEETGTDLSPENPSIMQKDLVTQSDDHCVPFATKSSESSIKAGDEIGNFLFDNEAYYWKEANFDESDWKTADCGDRKIIDNTAEDEKVHWREPVSDEIFDWTKLDYGDAERGVGEVIEDKQNDWKDILIDDWRIADFGDRSDEMFENKQESSLDDNVKWSEAEMANGCNYGNIDCRAVASAVEHTCSLTEVNGPPDNRPESDHEHHSHSNFISTRNDEKMEEKMAAKYPIGQSHSSFERNQREVSNALTNESDFNGGKPEEDVPSGTELDLRVADIKSPGLSFNRGEDKQDGFFAEGHPSEAEEQDIASVQRNTVSEIQAIHFHETEPVNDDAEEHASSSSSTASTVQTSNEPTQKVSAYSTAIDEKIECSKIKKAKVTPKKITNSRQPDTRRPIGLQNLGNTCFFNAVMQNLNQSFALFQLLKEEASDQLSLTKSMNRFHKQMCSGNSSTVTPSDVLQNVCRRSPRFRGGRQQDSHELLRHLLDGLRNEERESLGNPNNRKVLTKVDKVFGGHFMTVYTCKDCKTPYHVCEPMLDISLPIAYENFEKDEESNTSAEENETAGDNAVYQKAAKSLMTPLVEKQKEDVEDSRSELGSQGEPQQSNRKRKKKNKKSKIAQSRTNGRSILDCLDAFTRTEHIADEYLCMACHAQRVNEGATEYQMTSATKRTLIYNPPALLTLHLKRFEQTQYGFVKCNNGIAFHDMIDVGPYCSSWCMRNAEQERNIWYSLYGLVVHGGSLDGGHYVAYVKLRERRDYIRQFLQESYLDRDQLTEAKLVQLMQAMHDLSQQAQTEKWQPQPVKGSWFYVSDSHFSPVPEQEVWQQQAYLLFYERIGKNRSICYQRCTTGKTETSV